MKFAIFGNTYQAKKSTHAETLFRLLERRNAQLCICREFYNFLTSDLHMTIASAELFDGDDFTADMVISIGGDGTFLKAASRVGKRISPFWVSIPVASVSWQTFLRKRWKRLSMKFIITTTRWKNVACCNYIVMTKN